MSAIEASDTSYKLNSIQALRALAAAMVTVAHAAEEAKYFFSFTPIFETTPLGKGVDLFFVISGFIIYYASRNLFGSRQGVYTFIYNRLSRVIPLYFLFTTLMVFAVVALPGGVKEAQFDIWQIVSSYTFIPYERYDGRIAPILSLGWTLNYEVFFYILFASVMWLPARRAAAASIGILLALAAIGVFVPEQAPAPLKAWTFNIILEFAMGVAIALAYERVGKAFARSIWPAALLASGGLTALYLLNLPGHAEWLPRFISAGAPTALVVAAAVLLLPASAERQLPKWTVALGDSSYSLYLSHRFIQRPIQIVLSRLPVDPAVVGGLYMVLAVGSAIAMGHLLFVVLERPLLRRLRRRRDERALATLEPSSSAGR